MAEPTSPARVTQIIAVAGGIEAWSVTVASSVRRY
jgi:hypothetical protein